MSKKQKNMLGRILVAVVFWIIVLCLPFEGWSRLMLFLLPYAIVGYDVVWGAVRNIFRGQIFDEKFLMALATVGAFATGEHLEAVAVMLFYQVGELFQSIAVGKSRKSIASLMDIRPDRAVVLRDGQEMEVFPDEVMVGETLLVCPGEKIPLDGVVLEGESTLDTAMLTGESLPRECMAGDEVLSGSINLNGVLKIKVQKPYEQSTVSKILELVENSAIKKARAERFITRFAKYYTPCVVLSAVLLACVPPLFIGGWSEWIHRALIFLVVSCPCALVISVPLSFFGGIGGASRKGILIKGGNDLEALSKVKTIVFDKTGTLTTGVFSVADIHSLGMNGDQLLEYVALAEYHSNHPIAVSICCSLKKDLDYSRLKEQEELAGNGVRAVIDDCEVLVGNERLMRSKNVSIPALDLIGTAVYVALDGAYAGYITVLDGIKEGAEQAVSDLKKAGVETTAMLSGDRKSVAFAVGQKLGLDRIEAELLPQHKVECLERLLDEKPLGSTLAYVGDGINDAPVLARADIGIAMGALGSDAAIEAADIVLMDDQLKKLPQAIGIARKTMKIVKQNIIFSLAVKGAVLLLGALGFADIWLAVFADVGVMIIAILNAMRSLKS